MKIKFLFLLILLSIPLIGISQINTMPGFSSTSGFINKLEVLGTTNVDKFIRFRNGGSAPQGFAGIQFSNYDNHSWFNYAGSAGQLIFSQANGNPTINGDLGTPMFVLTRFGNVGIGTVTPASKLEVEGGGVSINGQNSIASVNGFRNSLQLKGNNAAIVFNPGEASELMFGFHNNRNFLWGTGGNTSSKPNYYAMQLNSDTGNLGIRGKLTANEVNVKTGGWADHVFLPDYPLMSLKELEFYIQRHGHLPNISTEAEIKKNGVDLGEMNVKLLEKVEELTLHLIEKDKEIQALRLLEDRIIKLEKYLNDHE